MGVSGYQGKTKATKEREAVDWHKRAYNTVEFEGRGSAYIKVWQKPVFAVQPGPDKLPVVKERSRLFLWLWFVPGDVQEEAAYARACQVMGENPGASWVVSMVCTGACQGIEAIGDHRLDWAREGAENKARFGVYEEALLNEIARAKTLVVGADEDVLACQTLAELGYAFEVAPSTWAASDVGKKKVLPQKRSGRRAAA